MEEMYQCVKRLTKSREKRKKKKKSKSKRRRERESSSDSSSSSSSDSSESSSESSSEEEYRKGKKRKRSGRRKESKKRRRGKSGEHCKVSSTILASNSPSQSTVYTRGCKSPSHGVVTASSDSDSQKSGHISSDANTEAFVRSLETSLQNSTPIAEHRRSRDSREEVSDRRGNRGVNLITLMRMKQMLDNKRR